MGDRRWQTEKTREEREVTMIVASVVRIDVHVLPVLVVLVQVWWRNEQSCPDGANAPGLDSGTTSGNGSRHGSLSTAAGSGEV